MAVYVRALLLAAFAVFVLIETCGIEPHADAAHASGGVPAIFEFR